MYAIVDIAGQQFKVTKDQKHFVHRLDAEVGATVEFENVLLTDENGKITIGEPFVVGTKVTAKVLMQTRGEKVIVFKKKRRKGYRKSTGHRDYITQIQIESIGAGKPKRASKPKKEVEAVEEVATESNN